MSRHKGDIIINPWENKEFCGDLNPCYATIYIGSGKCVDYLGRTHRWDGLNDKNPGREYKTVGHIDINLKAMIIDVLAKMEVEHERFNFKAGGD